MNIYFLNIIIIQLHLTSKKQQSINFINLSQQHMAQSYLTAKKQQLFELFKETKVSTPRKIEQEDLEEKKIQRFSQILSNENMTYEEVKKLSWNGIPQCVRAKIWKYLLKYVTGNKDNSIEILERKRNQYKKFVNTYLPVYNLENIEDQNDKKIAKIIEGDIKRTLPEAKIMRNDRVKELLTRCLFIWHIRHPASGYVQGINDLVVPFFLVFLSEYHPLNLNEINKQIIIDCITEETLNLIQADIYYCISKMLDTVANNYVRGFGGIHEAYKNFQILLKKVDLNLYNHLVAENIDLFCLSFRQISTFLLRLFSPKVGIRFFDTLISYEEDYPTFILQLLVAILVKYSRKLTEMGFDQIMKFFQNLPTKKWNENELETLLSQAYVYTQLNDKKTRVL